ncbi:MAG TPA: hypothetical protein VNG51_08805 [Ktedonobacteraceae bacterium]|nr:hypothetical protein [Ktedonobacteraceae bacterium]
MVNVSPDWRQTYVGMTAQAAQDFHMGQDATTRTMACPVCKALYTPAPAHQQLVLAPHIVLESAFMSMCHFCFRCRRAACPDCWDAVHGICGACVMETKLPFRTQVKALNNAMPLLSQEQQVIETMHAAPTLVCIQHGKFYVEPSQPSSLAQPEHMNRPVRVAPAEVAQRGRAKAQWHSNKENLLHGMDDGRPQGATPPHHPTPVPTMSAPSPRDRHSRDGGGWGPLRASVVLPSGWITDALGAIEQWLTGALLVLLLTIITMIVLAEASPSANTQIMHILQIDIRSEVAYLIQLIGQL